MHRIILIISINKRLVSLQYQQVFSILLFSGFREIEGAGQQRDAVNNDDLVIAIACTASM